MSRLYSRNLTPGTPLLPRSINGTRSHGPQAAPHPARRLGGVRWCELARDEIPEMHCDLNDA
jgi:hypothetical protein